MAAFLALTPTVALDPPAFAAHDADIAEACPMRLPDARFTDVQDNLHREAIGCAYWWRVTNGSGDNAYLPSSSITRGQMATFLANAIIEAGGELPEPTRSHFSDLESSAHRHNIERLAEAGVVSGKGDGTYRPGEPVRRDQMASFLVNAHVYRNGQQPPTPGDHFDDTEGNAHEHRIGQAYELGLAKGVSGRTYAPTRLLRRDQMASFVARLLDSFVEAGLTAVPVDDDPPDVTSFSADVARSSTVTASGVSRSSADGDYVVVLTAELVDDRAGVSSDDTPTEVTFEGPSGEQQIDAPFDADDLVSGDLRDGTFQVEVELPDLAEPGTWRMIDFVLEDHVGNAVDLVVDELAERGIQTTFEHDVTPPELRDFSLAPTAVDTSSGPQKITFTAHLVDDGVGVAGDGYSSSPTQVRFVSPSGDQSVSALFQADQTLASGTPQDGHFTFTATLPQGAESGTWEVDHFLLVDQVGNHARLSAEDMRAAGLPTAFEQTGQGDVEPPVLLDFSISPTEVDTSGAAQTLAVRARLTDDGVGVSGTDDATSPTQVRLRSPSGGQYLDAMFLSDQHLVSGTANDGIYEYQAQLPRYAEQGTWTVEHFLLFDGTGNQRRLSSDDMEASGMSTGFRQIGVGDVTPPEVRDFSISPVAVDTGSADQNITFQARLVDEPAGVAGDGFASSPTQVRFVSPSGGQFLDAIFHAGQHLVSGTANDGLFRYTATLPHGAEKGTWEVSYFLLVDQVGNHVYMSAEQMRQSGFPTSFRNGV